MNNNDSPSPDINHLFRQDALSKYDTTRTPELYILKGERYAGVDDSVWEKWDAGQREFIGWSRGTATATKPYVEESLLRGDRLFAHRGELTGNVLDVGGGWGLFRRWWNPSPNDSFVVHDPALERFLGGAPSLYRELYGEALKLPMTFVVGYGEELPYADASFQEFICAAALDHTMQPERVLAEGYRCLKSGGRVLVILHLEGVAGTEQTLKRSFGKRLLRALRHPFKTIRRIFRGPPQDHHMHHFTVDGVLNLLKAAGFTGLEHRPYGENSGAVSFFGKKE